MDGITFFMGTLLSVGIFWLLAAHVDDAEHVDRDEASSRAAPLDARR